MVEERKKRVMTVIFLLWLAGIEKKSSGVHYFDLPTSIAIWTKNRMRVPFMFIVYCVL